MPYFDFSIRVMIFSTRGLPESSASSAIRGVSPRSRMTNRMGRSRGMYSSSNGQLTKTLLSKANYHELSFVVGWAGIVAVAVPLTDRAVAPVHEQLAVLALREVTRVLLGVVLRSENARSLRRTGSTDAPSALRVGHDMLILPHPLPPTGHQRPRPPHPPSHIGVPHVRRHGGLPPSRSTAREEHPGLSSIGAIGGNSAQSDAPRRLARSKR